MTRIPLTGRSAPPRSRLARALAAAVVVLALGATAAVGATDVADQSTAATQASAATSADATPTPVTVTPNAPDPAAPADPVTDPTATPVVQAPTPTAPAVDPTAPEPANTPTSGTDPATTPATPTGTPATPPSAVTLPDAVGPDAVTPGATAGGTTIAPATLPATVPVTAPTGTPVTAPEPAGGSSLPVAARGADAPPVVKPVKPAIAPAVVPDLTPQLGTSAVLGNEPAVAAASRQPAIPQQRDASERTAGAQAGTVKLTATLDISFRATSSDEGGSLLQILAGYVFPGASSNSSGAIILLFTVAMLIATVTPRIPRLHLATLVAQRGAGCPGYNPVALRPG